MSKTLKIFTDGGSRGNPGNAGAGIFVTDENDLVIYESAIPLGIKTNNEAEYAGFLLSAKWLVSEFLAKKEVGESKNSTPTFKPTKIEWFLDSKLVVEQLNKRWKIKEVRLRDLATQCWEYLNRLSHPFDIKHVTRDLNAQADALANQAMDSVVE